MNLGTEDTGRTLIQVDESDYLTCRCGACVPLGWSHTCPDRVDVRRIAK